MLSVLIHWWFAEKYNAFINNAFINHSSIIYTASGVVYSRGILSISFRNLLLISSNISFLLISVLLEPEVSGAEVEMAAEVGAIVPVVAPVGSAAGAWSLNRWNFIVKD